MTEKPSLSNPPFKSDIVTISTHFQNSVQLNSSQEISFSIPYSHSEWLQASQAFTSSKFLRPTIALLNTKDFGGSQSHSSTKTLIASDPVFTARLRASARPYNSLAFVASQNNEPSLTLFKTDGFGTGNETDA
jgi:hypothetical protein